MYREPLVVTSVIGVFGVDLTTGITRNVGKMFPEVAEKLPNTIIATEEKPEQPIRVVEK